jgi:glycerophosphoryl diester phosphodiesterase
MSRRPISVIAHRGASLEAPENTLKSFQKAITIGANYIEFDVHRSRDGNIVVIHDEKLKRTTGIDGLVQDFTTSQLSEMDAGEGEHIPTLDEVIHLCKGKINLQIEIKDAGLAPKLIDTLSRNNLGQVLISSFFHEELSVIKNLNFCIPCATLDPSGFAWVTAWVHKARIIRNTKGRQMEGTHPFHKIVNNQFIRLTHAAGLFVNPWTVDDPARMRQLLEWGVDGIITNEPRQLLGILKDLGLPKKE